MAQQVRKWVIKLTDEQRAEAEQVARSQKASTLTSRRAQVLRRQVRSDTGTSKTLDGKAEAQLVTLCCSTPPAGQQRWTLQLLVDELCRLKVVGTVCRETIRQSLKKIASSPGKRNASASRKKTAPVSLRTWNKSSTSTTNTTTKRTR